MTELDIAVSQKALWRNIKVSALGYCKRAKSLCYAFQTAETISKLDSQRLEKGLFFKWMPFGNSERYRAIRLQAFRWRVVQVLYNSSGHIVHRLHILNGITGKRHQIFNTCDQTRQSVKYLCGFIWLANLSIYIRDTSPKLEPFRMLCIETTFE